MVLENCSNKLMAHVSAPKDRKVPSSSNTKFDCLDCEVFKRKIKENEQTVSSRDVLIEMLQGEIRKIQNLYKGSIDDYEKLRFIHCSTVHDYSSLKEIYRKIEAENRRLSEEKELLSAQLNTLENLQKQLGQYKNENCQQNATDDFTFIENIMQTQNQSLKLILSNFLEDLKISKFQDRVDKPCGGVKTDDNELEKLRQENKKIRENLNAKQEHLSKCLEVLEKNHLDIGNLSKHIENICCERDKCLKLLDDKDEEIAKLQKELENIPEKSFDAHDLTVEKERYRQENMKLKKIIETYKSDSEAKDDIIEKHDDEKKEICDELGKFRRLSEQLQEETVNGPVKEELKELRRSNEFLIQERDQYIEKIKDLENNINQQEESYSMLLSERDELREVEKQLRNLLDSSDPEVLKQMNEQLQLELDQLKEKLAKCKCDFEDTIGQLESSNNNLRDTLAIITTENKSNLTAKDQLNDELKKARSDLEKCENEKRTLEREIEDCKNRIPSSLPAVTKEERSSSKCCSCSILLREGRQNQHSRSNSLPPTREANHEECNNALKQLEEKNKSLQHDLDEANLEIAEYDEENRCLRQKLETSLGDIAAIEEEQSKMKDCCRESNERQNKMRQEFLESVTEKDDTIKQLRNEIDRLAKGSSCYSDEERSGGKRKLVDLQAKNARLEQENELLKTKLDEVEQALTSTSDHTEEKALILERRIELLEKQDKEKQKRLETCCEEMDKIQVTLNTNDLDNDINDLKNINIAQAKEIDSLKNSIEEYKLLVKKCDCMDPELDCKLQEFKKINEELKDRIEQLEGELNDKQCVILKLEECLDKSNKILGDCEEELKLIHLENERLKNDLEVLRKNLDDKTLIHKTDKNMLEERISQTRRKSEQLELENTRLLSKANDQKMIEDKIAQLQHEYNKLLQLSKEKDIELERITKQFELLQGSFNQPNTCAEKLLKQKSALQEDASMKTNQLKDVKTERKTSIGSKKSVCIADKVSCTDEKNVIVSEDNNEELKCLQCKNDGLRQEVGDLKHFVNKVVSDNYSLKLAMTNLLNTVINNIKSLTDSGDNLQSSPTGNVVATEVISSLQRIEQSVSNENEPPIPTSSRCDCMNVIKSRYNLPEGIPPMGQCSIPCGGVCNKNSGERKIETIMNVKKAANDRQSGSWKVGPLCDLCCEKANESCCIIKQPTKTIEKLDGSDDFMTCHCSFDS